MKLADLGGAEISREPFPHLQVRRVLPSGLADNALRWLREDAPWELRVEDFYEQHEFSLQSAALPENIRGLASEVFTDYIGEELARRFGEASGLRLVDAAAHRLRGGQTIRIHNDWVGDEETHRLLIQLNDGWSVDQGGLLMLFGSEDPADLRRAVLPLHGSGFAFEIGPRSHHAVSATRRGERFTLVYTFRRRAGAMPCGYAG